MLCFSKLVKWPIKFCCIINLVLTYLHSFFFQQACLKGNLIAMCLEQLTDPHPLLRQWLALCLGLIWTQCDAARWCGIRDSAQEKLSKLLTDPLPEVNAFFSLVLYLLNLTLMCLLYQ